ncbi:hypothetical protein QFZ33_004177 [Arthrobacter globiformis]|nr:hypothetical protein [Arthrobacter globiformis]
MPISSIIPGCRAFSSFSPPLQERHPAVDEDDGAQDGRDPRRPGEFGRHVAEDVREHWAEVHHRDRQGQGEPEPVLEHGRAVPGMLALCVDHVVVVSVVFRVLSRGRLRRSV